VLRTNPWAAIVGRGEDKRVALRAVVDGLRARGLRVGGLLQQPTGDGGLLLVNVEHGAQVTLACRDERTPDICDLSFDSGAFAQGRRWIAESDAEVVMLEIGKLEARGQAHWASATDVLHGDRRRLALLCIRPDKLFDVAYELPDPSAGLELPASDGEVARFVDALVAHIPR
jgi:hypothetical protein